MYDKLVIKHFVLAKLFVQTSYEDTSTADADGKI